MGLAYGLLALVVRKPTIIDPFLAQPDRKVLGRDADIKRIDAAFKDRGGLPAVAITGPGGYGKTALAGEYARRRERRYRGVWLVDATSLGDTRNSLARLGARLGVAVPEKAEEGIDCVLSALKDGGERWLLIHDNIDDPARLGELQHQLQLPDSIDHLLTGRVTDWTGKAETVALDVLPGDEAEALLAAESGRDGEDGLAEMATGVLDRHPLALVVAGQILRRSDVSVEELSGRFHERLKDAPESEAYKKSIYAAVVESLKRLNPDAQSLLKLAAYLSPDDIAPEFLVDGAEAIAAAIWEPLPEPLASLATDAMRRGDAFAACVQHSLLAKAEWAGPGGEPQKTHSIHRLTQAVLRDWMGTETQARMIGLAARLGRAQFTGNPQYDVAAWPRYHRLAPHGRALAPLAAGAAVGDRQAAASFVHQTAMFVRFATGDMAEARRLSEANLPVMAAACGAESNDYAFALGNLADTLDELGEDAEAEQRYREAIAVREAATEESDPRRAYERNNLGAFYWRLKRFAEAESELKAALEIIVVAYGDQGELVGTTYGNLGALYSTWADENGDSVHRQHALENTRKGLEITSTALGPFCFETATGYHNLASNLAVTGAQGDAATHQLRAAAIPLAMAAEGMIGQDHPQIAKNLAPLEHYFREAGREADIPHLPELLKSEATAVLAEHAEWQAAQDVED